MVKCPKCNQILEDNVKFCPYCGFTPSAGANKAQQRPAPKSAPAKKDVPKKVKRSGGLKDKLSKLFSKKVIIAVVAAILVVVIVVLLCATAGSGKKDYTLFIKNKELYFSEVKDDDSLKISNSLVNNSKYKPAEVDTFSQYLSRYCHVSDNSKKIFYIDSVNSTKGTSTLYWRKLTNLKKEPVELAKNVVSYEISENYKLITYLTLDGELCQHNLKESQKIAESVSLYAVSEDGKMIFYVTDSGDLYLKKAKETGVKLDTDVTDINAMEDFSSLYYVSNGILYKKDLEGEKAKISAGVENIVAIYETGEVYYIKTASSEQSLMDYIIDDMKEIDEKTEAPVQPKQPYSWNYASNAEFEKAKVQYETDKNNYEQANAAYTAKLERDKIRQDAAAGPEEIVTYSLFIHDGLKETVLADSVYRNDYEVSYHTPVIAYKTFDSKSISKVKISKINSSYEVQEAVEKAFVNSVKQYIAVGNKATLIENTDACRFRFSEDGKSAYFLERNFATEDQYNLYKVSLTKEKAKNPKLYDSEVSNEGFELLQNKKIKYFKNVKDGSGSLYINKDEFDTAVYTKNTYFHDDTKTLYYFAKWNSKTQTGTLKTLKGSTVESVADKVHIYQVTPDSTVYFLTNYSNSSYSGDLYSVNGKKATLIDKGVSGIIPIYNKDIYKTK
ncbi:MAG: zinc ribbon domain-containing protein [Clostridia bacterium]|nr:zinc ribbon domain-containing protein [Clostridia bacterium]